VDESGGRAQPPLPAAPPLPALPPVAVPALPPLASTEASAGVPPSPALPPALVPPVPAPSALASPGSVPPEPAPVFEVLSESEQAVRTQQTMTPSANAERMLRMNHANQAVTIALCGQARRRSYSSFLVAASFGEVRPPQYSADLVLAVSCSLL
jgi:hypothetical protein